MDTNYLVNSSKKNLPDSLHYINHSVDMQLNSQMKTIRSSCLISKISPTFVIIFMITLATGIHGVLGGRCHNDMDCEDDPNGNICIHQSCSEPLEKGSTCGRDQECKSNLICLRVVCDCASNLMWHNSKEKCVECEYEFHCSSRGLTCQDNQCVSKGNSGYSYLPLIFAFAILVSIVLIFSFKIITTPNRRRMSTSRQQLFDENIGRRRRSTRRSTHRQISSDLPDYAPPPPYSVAIATSPVIFTQPVVSTISTPIVGVLDAESPSLMTTTNVPLTSTTNVLTTVTSVSKTSEA